MLGYCLASALSASPLVSGSLRRSLGEMALTWREVLERWRLEGADRDRRLGVERSLRVDLDLLAGGVLVRLRRRDVERRLLLGERVEDRRRRGLRDEPRRLLLDLSLPGVNPRYEERDLVRLAGVRSSRGLALRLERSWGDRGREDLGFEDALVDREPERDTRCCALCFIMSSKACMRFSYPWSGGDFGDDGGVV